MANKIIITEPALRLGVTLNAKKAYKVVAVELNAPEKKTPVSEVFMGKNHSEHLPTERKEGCVYEVHRIRYAPGGHHVPGQQKPKQSKHVFFVFDEPSKILTIVSPDPRYISKVASTISNTVLFKEEVEPYTHMVKLNDTVQKEKLGNIFSEIFPSNISELNVKDLDTKNLMSRSKILEPYKLEFVEE